MKSALSLLVVLVLSACVRHEPERAENKAYQPGTPAPDQTLSSHPTTTPAFDSLPAQWRETLLLQLGGVVDYELVTDLGADHLGRRIRAVEPCRSAWSAGNVALLADDTPLGLLDVNSIQAGYRHEFAWYVCGQGCTFLSVVSKTVSGTGVWFFTRNVFRLTQNTATLALSIPAWGHLCGWGFPEVRDYSCPIRIEDTRDPVLTCNWHLDIDEGILEIKGSCRFVWNANTNEFYPEDRGEGERLESLGWDGEDQLINHHFTAFRNWAKATSKPASDWLLKLRQGCKLESSRVLIDLILS